jgi:stage II sporulation protein AB (anti-sigma F factor)
MMSEEDMRVGANFVVLEFPSLSENVGLARLAVAVLAADAGFTVEELEEIKVAVSEAVTNAIVHGYPGRSDGTVRVEAHRSGSRLRIRVVDEGVGIADVARALDPEPNDDPERLGLGFAFMRAFMDELAVESDPGGGTEVEMEKVARVEDPARDVR